MYYVYLCQHSYAFCTTHVCLIHIDVQFYTNDPQIMQVASRSTTSCKYNTSLKPKHLLRYNVVFMEDTLETISLPSHSADCPVNESCNAS